MKASTTANDAPNLALFVSGSKSGEEISDLISDSSFFPSLEANECEILSKWFRAYSAKAGTVIFQEGERFASLYIVIKGKIEIFKEVVPGKRKKIATIKEGRSIGEMSIVDGQMLSATAVAQANSILLMITKSNFDKLIEKYPSLGNKMLCQIAKTISMRLRMTTGQLADYI